jgi:hypothetical protein
MLVLIKQKSALLVWLIFFDSAYRMSFLDLIFTKRYSLFIQADIFYIKKMTFGIPNKIRGVLVEVA